MERFVLNAGICCPVISLNTKYSVLKTQTLNQFSLYCCCFRSLYSLYNVIFDNLCCVFCLFRSLLCWNAFAFNSFVCVMVIVSCLRELKFWVSYVSSCICVQFVRLFPSHTYNTKRSVFGGWSKTDIALGSFKTILFSHVFCDQASDPYIETGDQSFEQVTPRRQKERGRERERDQNFEIRIVYRIHLKSIKWIFQPYLMLGCLYIQCLKASTY